MNQTFQFMIFTLANDHFIIWPSCVTLTFNLPEQMFQMNNRAKLFWNQYINVEVMARTMSVYDLLSGDLQVLAWSTTFLKKFSNGTSTLQGEQVC